MRPNTAPEFVDRVLALRPALLRHAAFLIDGRSLGSPEDFVQDTIVTALRCAERYVEGSLSGWLTQILRGHILNASQRARVRRSVLMSPDNAAGDDLKSIDVPVAASQEIRLDLEDVMAALETLPAAYQDIIWLVRIDGLSPEVVAEKLGVQLGTVYTRLHRATKELRAVYDAGPGAMMRGSSHHAIPREHA